VSTKVPDSDTRLSVAIVDDEELARSILREYLASQPDVDVVAECSNGFEAVKAVADLKPDLMLLDVQMPKLNGFEVLELIGTETPVIFVTAFDSYAIRAFEIHAVDYLLKPFSAGRLAEALERARLRIRRGEPVPVREIAAAGRERARPLHRFLIRDRADVHVVPIAKVDYIESQDDYVAIRSGGRSHLKEQTLAELETLLDSRAFVRIHRRYILNVSRLVRIEVTDTDSRIAVLADGSRLPVSRTGYARLRELL
jgi:two-component system, LytTR family, response regulator